METPNKVAQQAFELELEEKSIIWEDNHAAITRAYSDVLHQYERRPTKTELAKMTGLHRNTVAKHMHWMALEDTLQEAMSELKFITPKITAVLEQRCLMGDMKAIRLVYELTGQLKKDKGGNTVNAQNVQINQHH